MSLPERAVTARAEGRKSPLPTAGRAPDSHGRQGKAPRKARLHGEGRDAPTSSTTVEMSVDARDTQTPGRAQEKLGSRQGGLAGQEPGSDLELWRSREPLIRVTGVPWHLAKKTTS